MMSRILILILVYSMFLLPSRGLGDIVKLKDGTVLEGEIVNENVSLVIIETERGRRSVPRPSIFRIERDKAEPRVWKASSKFVKVGKLEYLPDKSYLGAAKEAIESAQKEIDLIMYFLKPGSMETDELIDALITASQRDVDVKVVLESSRDEDISHFHEEVYQTLKDNGIDVRFSGGDGVTHARLLVIDDDMAILGSHHWTESSLSYNSESSVLIKSGEFGKLCGEYARGLFDDGVTLEEMKQTVGSD